MLNYFRKIMNKPHTKRLAVITKSPQGFFVWNYSEGKQIISVGGYTPTTLEGWLFALDLMDYRITIIPNKKP